ncbi:MAG: TraR/DksA family transcriptional regulator [Gammaproteobacteria bacterium]|nr:MAG: TraR/DksA family transcriptional regulator [Gammaproteobacteria bacterium]RTZ61475.1 MAG: TraR/DksA family transcriptional regulator [Gammaproteobacteria bacterium]
MHSSQRKKLESLKQEIKRRVEKAKQDFTSLHSADWSEQVTERENEEVLEALINEGEEELAQIAQALGRMDEGNYGICASCSEPINPERLQALPYTSLCIRCASEKS